MNTIAVRIVAVVVAALIFGAYLWGANNGRVAAEAECAAEQARLEQANRVAIDEANKRLMALADQLSLKTLELDDAIAQSDAGAAVDPDGGAECLPSDSVRRINAVR